jgi:hypothetical protein
MAKKKKAKSPGIKRYTILRQLQGLTSQKRHHSFAQATTDMFASRRNGRRKKVTYVKGGKRLGRSSYGRLWG